jgi:ATP-binding cassette subfamily B protein
MRDAQLLVLDEPTAALDARAEFGCSSAGELMHGKTGVLISHRYKACAADRISLVDGTVEGAGTHESAGAAWRYADCRAGSGHG